MKLKLGIFVVLLLVFIGCAEEDSLKSHSDHPMFGFYGELKGKEVELKEALGDSFSLILSDSTELKVSIESRGEGGVLYVGNSSIKFHKAIKYKRYYYLHNRIDSITNSVVVIGKYFNRYYGFEDLATQNYVNALTLKDSLLDPPSTLGEELHIAMQGLIVDSLSSQDLIINPQNNRKVIRKYFKNFFNRSFLRRKDLDGEIEDKNKEEIEESLDLKEIDEQEEVLLYPNPVSNGEVTVSSDLLGVNGCKVFVNSMDGKELYSKKVKNTGKLKINVSDFESGTYVLTIELPSQKATKKFIVV